MGVNPAVSVIIIFLNAEKFLHEAVESVFAQTCQDWEFLFSRVIAANLVSKGDGLQRAQHGFHVLEKRV